MSVARFEDDAKPTVERWWYYLGAGVVLWIVWRTTTVIGVVVGDAVPEGVPLGFAVPLTFLCLLLPAVSGRPALVAALVGGSVAIAADGLPANPGMPLGALTGVGLGYLVRVRGRRAWRSAWPAHPERAADHRRWPRDRGGSRDPARLNWTGSLPTGREVPSVTWASY